LNRHGPPAQTKALNSNFELLESVNGSIVSAVFKLRGISKDKNEENYFYLTEGVNFTYTAVNENFRAIIMLYVHYPTTTQGHKPEDHDLDVHRRKNLKCVM
jgi:hypothetical protein